MKVTKLVPILLLILGGVGASPLAAQAPAARPTDVSSMDAIIAALYDVISGPAGQKRDWDRFKSLFAPGARLMPTGKDSTGKGRIGVWSPDEYVTRAGASLEASGFFESELGRSVERYGNVYHAFSAYDSKRTLADPKPFARGINSIQMFDDGSRWWIVSVLWESETPGNQIPGKYLKRGK